MPRAQSDLNSPYTFVKGLITEANKLSESENSMVDGANVTINRDGSCERRLGFDVEVAGGRVLDILFVDNAVATVARAWNNVNGDASKNFCIVQVGLKISFFDFGVTPLSDGYIGEVDISPFCVSTTSAAKEAIQVAATGSALLIVNKYCDPLWVDYNVDTSTFTLSSIKLKMRDFGGLPDGFKISERPTSLSVLHLYNLLNQGWSDTLNEVGVDNSGSGTASGGSSSGGGAYGGFGTELVKTLVD